MGRKFEQYKERQSLRGIIQATILRNEEGIRSVEDNPELLKNALHELSAVPAELKDPYLRLSEAMLPGSVEFCEETLPGLKQRHDEFVSEMKKRSAMYPEGI